MTDPSKLLERLPPVEKFMIIVKEMHKAGHKVPWKSNDFENSKTGK